MRHCVNWFFFTHGYSEQSSGLHHVEHVSDMAARQTIGGRTLFAGVPASKDPETITAQTSQLQPHSHHLGKPASGRDGIGSGRTRLGPHPRRAAPASGKLTLRCPPAGCFGF